MNVCTYMYYSGVHRVVSAGSAILSHGYVNIADIM